MYLYMYAKPVHSYISTENTCTQLITKRKNKFTHQWNSIFNLQQIFNHIIRNFINICESSGVNNLITRLIQIPFGFKRGHCSQFPSIIL